MRNKKFVARHKITGFETYDYQNKAGNLTNYIRDNDNVEIPTYFFRKNYFNQNGKHWYEQWFEIIELDLQTKKCPYCDWVTVDIDNRSGWFELHLKKEHNITKEQYLEEYPDDKEYFSFACHTKQLQTETDDTKFVKCEICGKKMKRIDWKHLDKHGITQKEYNEKYGDKTVSKDLHEKLSKITIQGNIERDYVYTSQPEKDLLNFIQNELNIICYKDKKKLKGKEIDIFIPSHNIGIEFNGCYWHSDKLKDKNYHYDKVTTAKNEGVRLIYIWDYEWINNQEYIKSYIKAQFGLCEKRIFARKCEVREIDYQTAKPLLEYHQQKSTKAQVYLGLYHDNELVLCMLFGKNTNNGNKPVAEWDVKREVCKEGYSIVGGKSKVFSYFVKKYNPQSVVSYVDRSKFTGKSYEIMGFKLSHIVPARYDWVINTTPFVFKKRQPSIYKKMMVLYNEGKVLKIYDAGRYCYVWKK